MKFVNEQQNVPAPGNFLYDVLDPLFKFAAVFGTCDHCRKIQDDKPFPADGIRYQAPADSLCQAFRNGGLANSRFPDQAGIILGPAAQNLHDPVDFPVASDDRIQRSLFSRFCQIAAVLVKGRGLAFRSIFLFSFFIRISDSVNPHGNDCLTVELLDIDIHRVQETGPDAVRIFQHRQQQMFRACRF